MKYYVEKELRNFEFWSGAKDTVEELTDKEINMIESIIEDENIPWSDTQINDFFWVERDTIAEWLGYSDFNEIIERNLNN